MDGTRIRTMSTRVGVVGCGNRLRGDDGVALEVLEAVRPLLSPDVRIVDADGLAPWQWVEAIVGLQKAVIIDAACLGKEPGAISRLEWNQEVAGRWPRVSGWGGSHSQGLGEALAQARYGGYALPSVIVVFAIEIRADHAGWGQKISAPVRAAVTRATALVIDELLQV